MKTMERILSLMSLLLVFMGPVKAEEILKNDTIYSSSKIINADSLQVCDTIVVKEVITRTDVIHRTETIVRYTDNPPVNTEGINGTKLLKETLPIREGGSYIWVPDSMRASVDYILKESDLEDWKQITKERAEFNPHEKVTFRGDTIPMVLRDRNLGRFDRGLFNFLFIPKGIWQVGITASYGEFSTSDLEILDLISDIDFSGKIFSVRPYFSYFIKNNISIGMRLGYTYGRATIGSFNVDIDEDMNFNLHDIMYKSTGYSASLLFTQYLGIARKGRFGVFNEVELALSGGNSDFDRPFNGELRKTHTTNFKAALNFSPGVCVYILDDLSFNVSLGVFGLYIQNEKQKVNGVDLGHRTNSGANFRFNIFNINFGIAVNI